jgi:hypothetical protein
MKRGRYFLLATIAMIIFAFAIASLNPGSAQGAKANEVTVANTSSEPVPTLAQGTTTVTGSIGLTGTPSVNVARMPSLSGNVTVDNTAAAPVLVSDVDNPARQPYQVELSAPFGPDFALSGIPAVPAEKRLVIEQCTAMVPGLDAEANVILTITTSVGGRSVSHWFSLNKLTTNVGVAPMIISQLIRLYADPGTPVGVLMTVQGPTPPSGARFDLTLSGYLVDVR